jgi:hypothetical protein
VAHWVQNCIIYHGVCNKNRNITFKPNRLLYIGKNKVCVHLTKDILKKTLYLTLSHCWGEFQVVSLFERNQNAFQDNIPWNDLPRTFQDAILVARRLRVSYLWIDSLCIIQDSANDWDREAKLMGDIYKNAVCSIAASDGAHSSHGCFFPRQPQILQPTMLSCTSRKQRYLVNETDLFNEHILYS